ncbi:MAG: hypothetical protein C0490_21135, partial [Marivirga sp.]|nr:hypothetical protein [Marivirga sp.]
MNNEEFYVGYFPEAPKHTSYVIRKTVLTIGILIIGVSLLLIWCQKKFAESNFEYGVNTTVEGFLFTEPVPHMVVPLGEASDGKKLFQNIMLVGPGKEGAEKVIEKIKSISGKSFIGSKVKLSGYLIYGDGKTLLQITEEDNNKIQVSNDRAIDPVGEFSTEKISVSGEVVDPKCYFGVMKPGEGKVHRSCAIRCIAGGIPAVFRSTGSPDYFLLVHEKSIAINEDILSLVGD